MLIPTPAQGTVRDARQAATRVGGAGLLLLGLFCLLGPACSSPASGNSSDGGGGSPDSAAPAADGSAAGDAAVDPWALYTIDVGSHDATLTGRQPGNPIDGLSTVSGRDYRFRLNPSAVYQIINGTQPDDQFDWNKLPGISDCGTVDLSVNGAMFGWRWRLDTTPNVLEITAYANNNSVHLTPKDPLFTLDAADLASDTPLRYRVYIDGNQYQFAVSGEVRGRTIDAKTTISRACATYSPASLKWAAGFYFGGTSTAPSQVTGRIAEIPFAP
jgi:hypothetical protein